MPALGDDQFAIDDYVFGYRTTVDVTAFDASYPDVVDQDKPLPREDGTSMGMDLFGGMTISIDLEVVEPTETAALDTLEAVKAAVMADDIRRVPQSYSVLSYRLATTGEQRRVYGRGRACAAASMDNAHVGFIPVAAQFRTITPYVYSDTEYVDSTNLVPDDTLGGLIGPLIGPLYASGGGSGSRGFIVGGFRPAWLATRVHGPIENPRVEIAGQWWYQLQTRIAKGDSVLVDPQPWSRQVRRASDGANLAGYLTGTSAWLADMRVPPGAQEVLLSGVDATGTASVEVFWRTVRSSL